MRLQDARQDTCVCLERSYVPKFILESSHLCNGVQHSTSPHQQADKLTLTQGVGGPATTDTKRVQYSHAHVQRRSGRDQMPRIGQLVSARGAPPNPSPPPTPHPCQNLPENTAPHFPIPPHQDHRQGSPGAPFPQPPPPPPPPPQTHP